MKHDSQIETLITGVLRGVSEFLTTTAHDLGPGKRSLLGLICLWSILAFAYFMGTRLEDLAIKVLKELIHAALAAAVWRKIGFFSGRRPAHKPT